MNSHDGSCTFCVGERSQQHPMHNGDTHIILASFEGHMGPLRAVAELGPYLAVPMFDGVILAFNTFYSGVSCDFT